MSHLSESFPPYFSQTFLIHNFSSFHLFATSVLAPCLLSLPNPFYPLSLEGTSISCVNSSFMSSKSQNHLCHLSLLQAGSFQVIPGGFLLSFLLFFFFSFVGNFTDSHPWYYSSRKKNPFHLSRECRLKQFKPIANCPIIKLEADYPFPSLPCYLWCAWRLLSLHCQSFSSPNLCIPFDFPPLVTVPRAALAGAPHSAAQSTQFQLLPERFCCFWGMLFHHDFHIDQDSAMLEGCSWPFKDSWIWGGHWDLALDPLSSWWRKMEIFFSVGWEGFAFNLV